RLFFRITITAPAGIYTLSLHDALPISPGRVAMAGPISVNRVCRTLLSRMTLTTWRRLATVSVLALVMRCSAYGRRRLALASVVRSEEHTSELQSRENLVCRLLLEKKKK